VGGAAGSNPSYNCADMPEVCPPQTTMNPPDTSDCGCLGYPWGQDSGGSFCQLDAAGHATVTYERP
jgi:hypothetical protein